MKWVEYPDDRARREQRDGVEREGTIVGPGPKQGTKWGLRAGRYVLLHPARGLVTTWYSLKGES